MNSAHTGLSNRWVSILVAEGIDESVLDGKQHPCPICAGSDRFRFDDKGEGRWYCNHCGAGDGYSMLCKKFGYDFREAKARVEKAAGLVQPRHAKTAMSDRRKRDLLTNTWNIAVPYAEGMRDYLLSRGIPERLHSNPAIRWHPSLRLDEHTTSPAIIIKCYRWGIDGRPEPATIQRHWVNLGTKKMMPAPIKLDGIFTPLGGRPVNGVLGVCEGYITALSVMAMQSPEARCPVWPCMSAEQLIKFVPPPEVHTLFIFIDVDKSFTGQAAGYALAKKLRNQFPTGLEIVVCYPTYKQNVDVDFNDKLKERACPPSSSPSPTPADAATPSVSHDDDCPSTHPSTSARAPSCAGPAARGTTGSIPTAPMDASSAGTPVDATTTATRTIAGEATADSTPN